MMGEERGWRVWSSTFRPWETQVKREIVVAGCVPGCDGLSITTY